MTVNFNSKQAHILYTFLLGVVNILTLLNSSGTWVALAPKLDPATAALIVAVASGLLGQAVRRIRDASGPDPVVVQPPVGGQPVADPAPAIDALKPAA